MEETNFVFKNLKQYILDSLYGTSSTINLFSFEYPTRAETGALTSSDDESRQSYWSNSELLLSPICELDLWRRCLELKFSLRCFSQASVYIWTTRPNSGDPLLCIAPPLIEYCDITAQIHSPQSGCTESLVQLQRVASLQLNPSSSSRRFTFSESRCRPAKVSTITMCLWSRTHSLKPSTVHRIV